MTPTQFMPSFPCYSVFDDDCRGPFVVEMTDGTKAMVVLTDEDLLRRLREENQAVGPTIWFDFPGQLAMYLDALAGSITHIGFDPASRTAVTVAAGELYKKLLGG